ncbi:MAG: type IV toxin-antitoxin system AbiEi family antitoxin domain-containing protein, partial [Angustibacter sp.]
WTGSDRACLSHDTALDAYEVCDINPTEIHLTVPLGRPIRRAGAKRYRLHYESLTAEQIGWWQGIPTVTLATAIDQCIHNGTPTYLLRQALDTAADRGDITLPTQNHFHHKLDTRDGL